MGFEKNVVAQFNAGFASLQRLHNALEDCNYYKGACFTPDYNFEMLKQFRFSIYKVRSEVKSKLTGKENKSIIKLLKLLKEVKVLEIQKTEEGNVITINKLKFHKHYSLLVFIEDKLRDLADKKGMLIPNKIEEDESVDNDEW